jgi:mRNA-degrading endonuclease RelE of RelBE toxin-antitoxin system
MPMRLEVIHEISDEKIIFRKVSKWSYKVIYTIDFDKIIVSVVDIIHGKQPY